MTTRTSTKVGTTTRAKWAAVLTAAAVAGSLTGCSGSVLFPTQAVMPATLEQAFEDVKDKDPQSGSVSDTTRAYLAGFDAAAARPAVPTRPIEPRPSALASERFTLTDLAMPARPADSTACPVIADKVGGGQAACAAKGDAVLNDALPAGVPAGSYVVGKAYSDGRMILLNQPGEGGQMWDAAMHERGHLLATWLCGRSDCLNSKFVARGYRDSSSYLSSLTEAFAQSWAQCNGARMRPDYVVLKCADVTAVVAAATEEKKAAKADYQTAKKSYDDALVAHQQRMREYDERTHQVEVLQRFAERIKAQAKASSTGG